MGADFCLAMFPADVSRREALARFADLVFAPDWATLMAETELVPGVYLGEAPLDDDDLEQCWTTLGKIADVLDFAYSGHYHRELTWTRVDGRWWVATGGMSWGDPPTDAWWAVQLLAELGLTYDEWDRTQEGTKDA